MNIPRHILSKWADNLYAMGKSLPSQKANEDLLLNLAKSIYLKRDSQLGDHLTVDEEVLRQWMESIRKLSVSESKLGGQITREISEIFNSMNSFLSMEPIERFSNQTLTSESALLWKSIALSFTLWYGGQTFSLTREELEAEMALNHNQQLKTAFEFLRQKSILSENISGLIVFNPRFKALVDAATFFLVAQGANIEVQLESKKAYSTMQSGFIQYSRSHHHPAVYLSDSIRSYVSDYCQKVFGKIFNILTVNNYNPDYSSTRRFVIRLSLYPSYDFVISRQKEAEAILEKLVDIKAAVSISDELQKYVLIKGEIVE